MLQAISITCPYCWQQFEIPFDPNPGDHELVEDCAVCCQPILIHLVVGTDGALVQAERSRENE